MEGQASKARPDPVIKSAVIQPRINHMGSSTTFDYKAHNKKVASRRGDKWRKNLSIKKLASCENPSVLKIKRVAHGFSQMEMLPRVDIKHLTTYARIERAELVVEKDRAIRIAVSLKTPMKEMFVHVDVNPDKYLAI